MLCMADKTFGQVITEMRQELGLTRSRFYDKFLMDKMSKDYLYRIEGDVRTPTIGIAHEIAKALGVTLDEMTDRMYSEKRDSKNKVPLVDFDDSENGVIQPSESYLESIPALFDSRNDPCFAFTVEGAAMTSTDGPSFPSGTIVIVAERAANPGDLVVAKTIDGVLFRKLEEGEKGKRFLAPLNNRYSAQKLSEIDVILGVVIGAITRL